MFRFPRFHNGKWNGPEIFLAYDTPLFNTRLTIYVKMDATYKRKTKAFHFPRGSFFAYISRPFSRTASSDISLDVSRTGERHRLENFPLRSIFHREKRGKWYM